MLKIHLLLPVTGSFLDFVTKIFNFIWAGGVNHRQFVALLGDHETENGDIGLPHSYRVAQPRQISNAYETREQKFKNLKEDRPGLFRALHGMQILHLMFRTSSISTSETEPDF